MDIVLEGQLLPLVLTGHCEDVTSEISFGGSSSLQWVFILPEMSPHLDEFECREDISIRFHLFSVNQVVDKIRIISL